MLGKKDCSQSNFGLNSLNFKGSSQALLGNLSKIYIHRGSTKWFGVKSVLKQHPHLNCHATTDNHHGHNSVHRGGVGDYRVRKRSNKVLYSFLASFLFSTCSILLDSVLNHWETTSSKISELYFYPCKNRERVGSIVGELLFPGCSKNYWARPL